MKYVYVFAGQIISSSRSNAVLAGIAHKSNEMLQEVLSLDCECDTAYHYDEPEY